MRMIEVFCFFLATLKNLLRHHSTSEKRKIPNVQLSQDSSTQFKILVVRPHLMTLLVKIMLTILGKTSLTLMNVSMSLIVVIEFPNCEGNGHDFPCSI